MTESKEKWEKRALYGLHGLLVSLRCYALENDLPEIAEFADSAELMPELIHSKSVKMFDGMMQGLIEKCAFTQLGKGMYEAGPDPRWATHQWDRPDS